MLDVGLIHPGVGVHKPQFVLHDQYPETLPNDLVGFRQNHLHVARILVDLEGQLNRLVAGFDISQIDVAILRLGDDLLSDDQHIVVSQLIALLDDRVAHQLYQVIPRLHHGNTGYCT